MCMYACNAMYTCMYGTAKESRCIHSRFFLESRERLEFIWRTTTTAQRSRFKGRNKIKVHYRIQL